MGLFSRNKDKGFNEGDICVVDRENNMGQDISGINQVSLVKRISKHTWECNPIIDGMIIEGQKMKIHEDNLSLGYKMIIRYPADLPVFNEKDSSCIEKIISIIESNNLDDVSCKDLNRLKLIKEKINHSLDFTRV